MTAVDPIRAYGTTRAMQALEAFASGPLSVPTLAEILQVDARTTRRLVRRLHHDGYLERVWADNRRSYQLTTRARYLGYRLVIAPGAPPPVRPW